MQATEMSRPVQWRVSQQDQDDTHQVGRRDREREEEGQVGQFYIIIYIQKLSKGECPSEEEPLSKESVPKKDPDPLATSVQTTDYPSKTRPESSQTARGNIEEGV